MIQMENHLHIKSKSAFFTQNVLINNETENTTSLKPFYIYAAQSTLNLSNLDVPDADSKKEPKRKTSRLSKGIMDFISMGDTIGYADRKLTK